MVEFGRKILSEWYLDRSVTFLNHAAYGAVPKEVFAAQDGWRKKLERQPVEFINSTLGWELKAVGRRLSHHIGASPGQLVFACNVSEAVSSIARSINWVAGDEILITDQTQLGISNIFSYLCARTGATLRNVVLPYPVHSESQIVDSVKPFLTERLRLAVFDHVSSKHSVVMPIRALVDICRDRGISVLVDGAHGPGMLQLEISELGADWYVGNCHKWLLAPKGSAFLVVSPDKQPGVHPATISTTYGQGFWDEFSWTGTRDPSPWLSISAALDFWVTLGVEEGRNYIVSLADWAGEQLASDWKTERGASSELTGAIVTVRVPQNRSGSKQTASALHDFLLAEHQIEVPIFNLNDALWVRISAHVYNEETDIMRLSRALR